MASLPQLGSFPAVYAVVAGDCDWPLPPAVGLSNNDVIELRPLRQFRCVPHVPYLHALRVLRWMETPTKPRLIIIITILCCE